MKYNTSLFGRVVVPLVAAVMLAGPGAAFAETPQEALDAAIAEAQETLARINFEGAIDPEKLATGLREGLAKVKNCDTSGLGKIKLALIGLMENRLYLTLRDIRDGKAGTGNAGILARELLTELFGDGKSVGIIKRYKERCEYLDLFPALERAWQAHTGGAFTSFTSAQIADYFDRNLWDAVQGKSEPWAKAMQELGGMRKLLAQMMNIRALHAKAYPAKSVPATPPRSGERSPLPQGGSRELRLPFQYPFAPALPKLLHNMRALIPSAVAYSEVYATLNHVVELLLANDPSLNIPKDKTVDLTVKGDLSAENIKAAHDALDKLVVRDADVLRKIIRNFPDLGNMAVRYFKALLEYYLYIMDQRSGTEAPTGKVPTPPLMPEEGKNEFGAFLDQQPAQKGTRLLLTSLAKGRPAHLRVLTLGTGNSLAQPQRVSFYHVPSSGNSRLIATAQKPTREFFGICGIKNGATQFGWQIPLTLPNADEITFKVVADFGQGDTKVLDMRTFTLSPRISFYEPGFNTCVNGETQVKADVPADTTVTLQVQPAVVYAPAKGIPKRNQMEEGSELPGGGAKSCSPTAVAASLEWFDLNDYPDVMPDGMTVKELVTILGRAAGTGENGTGVYEMAEAVRGYLKGRGLGDTFEVEVIEEGEVVLEHEPSMLERLIEEFERGQDVVLAYPGTPGHAVTVNGVTVKEDGSATISIMDPAIGSHIPLFVDAKGIARGDDGRVIDLSWVSLIAVSPADKGKKALPKKGERREGNTMVATVDVSGFAPGTYLMSIAARDSRTNKVYTDYQSVRVCEGI